MHNGVDVCACPVNVRKISVLRSEDKREISSSEKDGIQVFSLVGRIPGVGKVTEARMAEIGIKTVGDIHGMDAQMLEMRFGRWGMRLYELARGIDHNPVASNRPRMQISAEDTFQDDLPLTECESDIRKLAEKVWIASRSNVRGGRTIVLKLKTKEFSSLTRSRTLPAPPCSCDEFTEIAVHLCERVNLGPRQLYRLVGVGLSNFQAEEMESPAADVNVVQTLI